MLSQIRQISDGNYNTVFVKNKEQKFNLDKEIHDLECWKQSRNHVNRKEERELLGHLDKLRQQQEYLHHLDEERSGHVRGSQTSSQRRHSIPGSIPLTQNTSILSPQGRDSIQALLDLMITLSYLISRCFRGNISRFPIGQNRKRALNFAKAF
jgi:hypothetical protein